MSIQQQCDYCFQESETRPAKSTDEGTSIEFKADGKCWDFIFGPIMNYVSKDTFLSPQLLRFLLNSLDSIEDQNQLRQLQSLLEIHSMLHPPCRLGMYKYYLSVIVDPLRSHVFDQSTLSGNFFDLTRKIWSAIKSDLRGDETTSLPEAIPPNTTPKKTAIFSQNVLKLIDFVKRCPKDGDRSAQLNVLLFLFKFYVDILHHDLTVRAPLKSFSDTSFSRPLIVKLVWGSIDEVCVVTPHCEAMFALYSLIPLEYRQLVGKYIVSLAESVRRFDETAEDEFPYWGKSCFNFASRLSLRLTKHGVNSESLELIRDLPSNWLKHQVGVSLIHRHLINRSKLPSLSTKRVRKLRR